MTLVKFSPIKEIESFEKQMSRIFNDFPFKWDFGGGSFSPRINVFEDEKNLVIEAEIPGMEKNEVKVTLHNDVLTISGERKRETKTEKENYFHLESCYGSFNRSINLPVEVDGERVEASFKNGLLKIQLPKVNPKDISKTIEIQ
ncbi:MAG: Hsp20/alpha crystallin family protein [Bacteroidetes bacterium]|nr:Hsp20/alpha crystallin family protein [Bacteroidota bacterium]MBU1423949.1 Hsp20/alpha crystallin family protein [Bacteroidota bacterium]MBU2637302.1 Hsp20/alpha crystallin family protein [Bacteroidota bacterium]